MIFNEKYIFINDIKELLNSRTFRDEKWLEDFAHDMWHVKDYLKGYFTREIRPIRCKKCVHYNFETKGCKRNPSVEKWKEYDFCSYGEERI